MDGRAGDDAGVGGLVSLVPWRLCSGLTGDFSPRLASCMELSKRWQSLGHLGEFWELVGAEQDRLYELAGFIGGAGEQLALACLADHEFLLWTSADLTSAEVHERVAAEMAMRALAEMESYYVIGAGHALANLTGRVLALVPGPRQDLSTRRSIRTGFPPLSDAREDWVSMNSKVAHALRAVAVESGVPEFAHLADPAVELADGEAWGALDRVRGEHFHRWRSQSSGMTGAPKSSPWSAGAGNFKTISVGGGRVIGRDVNDVTASSVRQVVADARDCLCAAVGAFGRLLRPAVKAATGLDIGEAG